MSDHTQRTYDFCLRFFSDLAGLGVRSAVVSPGSRSSALAIAADVAGLDVTMQLDERVAGFHALGQAKSSGLPPILICTSGTAGANYLPAIIEANHAGVPLIVCTADRAPELRHWGAGQTIDQLHLYGPHVRWFHEVPVASEVDTDLAGVLALRCVTTAVRDRGPVHLNWPFREPLEPPGALVAPSTVQRPLRSAQPRPSSPELHELAVAHVRGLIVVGPAELRRSVALEISGFARRWGWPIIADPASGLRVTDSADDAVVITTAELLFGSSAFLADLEPCEVIVRIGTSPTSKAFRLWLESARPETLALVDPGTDWSDPTGSVTSVIAGPLEGAFAVEPDEPRHSAWLDRWAAAESVARTSADSFLADDLSELCVVRRLMVDLERGGDPTSIMVSNSMPVRDLDLAMPVVSMPLDVYANRGANGIEGIVATAAGIASMNGRRTFAILGDVAAIHDLGGLAAAARLSVDNLTVVVIDNGGGAIFSFLPVANVVDGPQFSKLFATPHGTDIGAFADALGFDVSVCEADNFAVPQPTGQPQLVLVNTTANATVAAVANLRDRVDQALIDHRT